VTEIFRTFASRTAARGPRRALVALTALGLSLATFAAPGDARVETAAGVPNCNVASESCYGLQPRNATTFRDGNGATGRTFQNSAGHPVLHSAATYVIYWDPEDLYRGEWQHLIDGFLANVGAEPGVLTNVFATDEQYTDASGKPAVDSFPYRGAYTDTSPYPTATCTDPNPLSVGAVTCLTDAQIRSQLQTYLTQHALPTGMGTIYYLLTPPGVAVCLDAGGEGGHCSDHTGSIAEATTSYKNSFCSYHSDISPTNPTEGDAKTVLYAVVPWIAGGFGDYYFEPREPGYDCQDGGFDPSTKPIEQHEKAKEHSRAEATEIEGMSNEEKQAQIEKEAREGPHEEQPNQAPGRTVAGDYAEGLADPIIGQIAAEQQDTVTDPLLNGWQDAEHNEAIDECRNFFASGSLSGDSTAAEFTDAGKLGDQAINGGTYYLNTAFNLAASRLPNSSPPCLGGALLEAQFTAPSPVNAGEVVGLDGMESTITLAATGLTLAAPTKYATYTWNYGDAGRGDETPIVSGYAPGSAPCEQPWLSTEPPASSKPPGVWVGCAASVYHSYRYGGTYFATLTVTDVAGNTTTTTREINVDGAGPTTSSSSGSSSSTAAGTKTEPSPVATAAVLSRLIASATHGGLVVKYSVNERVAGYFEVLLASSIANKIGIGGATAQGMPAGSPPAKVIARALLVTSRGGHSIIKIKFSSRTAARLDRLAKVTLTLRMIAHNASSQPVTTTLTRTVTLKK
jgi:hypothetical protein